MKEEGGAGQRRHYILGGPPMLESNLGWNIRDCNGPGPV